METKLKKYFPMIREREEVLADITENEILHTRYKNWNPNQQEAFLDICTGVRGMKFLYDAIFKEIMNPEYVPERFNDFLSCMLCQRVKVLKILPGDSTRIADETSLLIMDIVVELEDGSIANIEMQKIGYLFPGQRCACYSSDLLLRQYKRVRGEAGKKFSYRNIKSVYTIVLFEKSPREFHWYPDVYYHFFEQRSNTGLELELLQKYLFIPLDIFRKSQQNRGITERRDAWLTLLSCDEPEKIIELIKKYPAFRDIYRECYEMCQNTERVMDMFSEELYELDRNTVQYMIDEQQETIDAQEEKLNAQKEEIDTQKQRLNAQKEEIDTQKQRLNAQKEKIDTQKQRLNAQKEEIDTQKQKLNAQKEEIDTQKHKLNAQKAEIDKFQKDYEEKLKGTVKILCDLQISESEIITKICGLYQITEEEARKYL